MKRRLPLPAIIAGAVAVAFAAGWWLAPSGGDAHAHAGHAHAVADEAAQVWTCSMHPQIRQPGPGSCPLCGMDLIPIAADADDEDAGDLPRLRLSERSKALMGLRTAPVQHREAQVPIRLPGRIAMDERRLHIVSSRFGGRVDRLFVNFTGQEVRAGEPIMEVYSPELVGVQEEFLQASRQHRSRADDTSRRYLEGARDRLRLLGLTEHQVAEIEAGDVPLSHLTVVAPADGVILERTVSAGEYVETGTPLFSFADLSTVWAELEAYESELALLEVGQPVRIELTALPGEVFAAEIAFIDPIVDPVKRTARVRADLANPQLRLKPGMLADARIAAPLGDPEHPPLLVPASAPLFTGQRSIVYVRLPAEERPTYEARAVTLGRRAGDAYVVLEGLAVGELVVVNGQFKIDSELQIRGRPSMMAPAAGSPETGRNQPQAAAQPADPRDPVSPEEFAASIDPAFARELQPIIAAYLDLTEALAADDFATSEATLDTLIAHLRRVKDFQLSEVAAASWSRHYERAFNIAAAMADGATLDDYRRHLQELTNVMESLYVNFGADALLPVNRAYCPMVNGGIGTWLQRSGEIRNPYFGAAMLTCGEVFDQLGQ